MIFEGFGSQYLTLSWTSCREMKFFLPPNNLQRPKVSKEKEKKTEENLIFCTTLMEYRKKKKFRRELKIH